jgi:type VI secretion system secreted protein VgrG
VSDGSYTQEHRLLKIKTTLGETELLLEKFSGTEEVSTPFEFRVRLLSQNAAVDLKALLRTTATVSVTLADGSERPFNAVFRSLKQAQEGDEKEVVIDPKQKKTSTIARELVVYEGILVPQVWFLSLDANCRIFQDMTVPDIVEQILTEAGIRDFQFRAPLRDHSRYPPRDYCVQYRESSLNFISRLLEAEGIFYFFQHTTSKHLMVFADNSTILATCPGQPIAAYAYAQSGWAEGNLDGVIDI